MFLKYPQHFFWDIFLTIIAIREIYKFFSLHTNAFSDNRNSRLFKSRKFVVFSAWTFFLLFLSINSWSVKNVFSYLYRLIFNFKRRSRLHGRFFRHSIIAPRVLVLFAFFFENPRLTPSDFPSSFLTRSASPRNCERRARWPSKAVFRDNPRSDRNHFRSPRIRRTASNPPISPRPTAPLLPSSVVTYRVQPCCNRTALQTCTF